MAGTESIPTMDAQTLTRQARDVFQRIKQELPAQYRSELTTIIDELTGRVDFVARGRAPGSKTKYQALEASALAQQARHVLSQVARNVPQQKRESLALVETLADRVEFAAIGAPAKAGTRPRAAAGPKAGTRPRAAASR